MPVDEKRIEHIFKFLEYDSLSEKTHDLIISFENQWRKNGKLSERQIEVLEDIYRKTSSN